MVTWTAAKLHDEGLFPALKRVLPTGLAGLLPVARPLVSPISDSRTGPNYYLREVARVNGKPKIVSQRYLGKAEDIAPRWTPPPCYRPGPGTWPSATLPRSGPC